MTFITKSWREYSAMPTIGEIQGSIAGTDCAVLAIGLEDDHATRLRNQAGPEHALSIAATRPDSLSAYLLGELPRELSIPLIISLPNWGIICRAAEIERLDDQSTSLNESILSAVKSGEVDVHLSSQKNDFARAIIETNCWLDLCPTEPDSSRSGLADLLQRYQPGTFANRTPDILALKSGLLLWHGFIHASHAVSQSIEGLGSHRAGDYFHAIMHRMEPDPFNSKYWYRRVGSHPIHRELLDVAREIADITAIDDPAVGGLIAKDWNASNYVDSFEHIKNSQDQQLIQFAQRIQLVELVLLIKQTAQDAALI